MTKQERINYWNELNGGFNLDLNDTLVLFRFAGLPENWEMIIIKSINASEYWDPKFNVKKIGDNLFNISIHDEALKRAIVKCNGLQNVLQSTKKILNRF